jgi:two-component system NtrC family sensor kinase
VLTVLQTTGRIREANDAVRAVFGVEPHQMIGRTLLELLVPEDRPALEEALARAFAGTQARVEVHVQTSSGTKRVVALAVNGLPGADPPSALLVGRDMTQEREMRLRLMESDRLAAVGELVAGVAHEVNNPLSSISAFAQLLLRDDLSPAHRESIEVIRAETTRASQVVKDLLTFARRSDPQREPLDLNGVVARTLRLRQYQLAEASVRVRQELAPELPSVLGDARQLQQVCLNLLTNAVHAMTPQGSGTLTLRTSHANDVVLLEVSDTGPGISAGARPHVFEPFFTTKGEGEGTGLGLSVSYGIVKAHGGTIEVADTGPTGTTFRVRLPAVSARSGLRATPSDAQMPVLRSALAGLRLLFVDDEPSCGAAWKRSAGCAASPWSRRPMARKRCRTRGPPAWTPSSAICACREWTDMPSTISFAPNGRASPRAPSSSPATSCRARRARRCCGSPCWRSRSASTRSRRR